MLLIDKYAYTNNLNKFSPRIKIGIVAILIIASMLITNKYILASIILMNSFLIVYVAKINLNDYFKLLKIPMAFLVIAIITNTINISSYNTNFLHSIKIFNLYFGVSYQSIDVSLKILFRSVTCLTCVYFLILTTPFNQLVFVLVQCKLPSILIELTVLVYRFIFIFLEEVDCIRKSQQLRFGYINLKTSYKSLGILCSMLFTRMMKRYNDMCVSLDLKLYDGNFHISGDDDV